MLLEFDDLRDIVGPAGVLLYLGSYFALQSGLLRGHSYSYPALNMVAAGCVLFDLQSQFNLSAALIQVSWIAISVFGLVRLCLLRTGCRFSVEERRLLETQFPGLEAHRARRFLDAGHWEERAAGAVLLRAGARARNLVYVSDGQVMNAIGGGIGCMSTGRRFLWAN
ncbi:hypothetical protein SAMN05444722_1086 [Rhodovulum sp. ES.010]|uniref:CBU_0592 family membrane protein n=1 Tax=Rhodovulum sp. ES.010 TaxID=1882821 RepID=UPI0009287EAF|nr:hypothetical protein [Rhodovulum sp. ES.010]SIO26407.1 hypothetical protein SAMN05444722_1086 [Rhodovulum sp. ES.010]